jgi:hypothetical protein
MSAELVNLRKARKAKQRVEEDLRAAANRARTSAAAARRARPRPRRANALRAISTARSWTAEPSMRPHGARSAG